MNDLKTRLPREMARSRASASASESGAPIPIGFLRRIAGGMTASINAEREACPRLASIAAWSSRSGPMWRRAKDSWSSSCARLGRPASLRGVSGMGFSVRGDFFVGGGVEKLSGRSGVVGLHAEDPRGIGILVDPLGCAAERVVAGDDFTSDRRVDIGRGLHRLHHA